MTHTTKPYRNPQDVSHVADVGGSGVPLAPADFRTYVVSRLTTGVILLFALSVAVIILTHMARGDFGYSVTSGRAVREEIFKRLPSTLSLLPLTMILAAAVSIPLGVLAAARRGSLIDRVVGGAAVFGVGVPGFWLALMLILVLRMWSRDGPMNDLVLPSLVLAIFTGAVMVRIIRSSTLEVLDRLPSRRLKWGGLSGSRSDGLANSCGAVAVSIVAESVRFEHCVH